MGWGAGGCWLAVPGSLRCPGVEGGEVLQVRLNQLLQGAFTDPAALSPHEAQVFHGGFRDLLFIPASGGPIGSVSLSGPCLTPSSNGR